MVHRWSTTSLKQVFRCVCFFIVATVLCTLLITDSPESFFWQYRQSILRRLSGGMLLQVKEVKIPNCTVLPPFGGKAALMNLIFTPTYKCQNLSRIGDGELRNLGKVNLPSQIKKPYRDGFKYICVDQAMKPQQNDCIVYSFGIANQWAFDDEFAAYGCNVFAFDPTIKLGNHTRSGRIFFYNLGVSDHTGQQTIGKQICNVTRLENITHDLGLQQSKIDYIKMDIEGSELAVFDDIFRTSLHWLLNHVLQIGIEIHIISWSKMESVQAVMMKYWDFLQRLNCLGFKLLNNDPNVGGAKVNYEREQLLCCYELLLVNSNLI